jgi:hypothetical protein
MTSLNLLWDEFLQTGFSREVGRALSRYIELAPARIFKLAMSSQMEHRLAALQVFGEYLSHHPDDLSPPTFKRIVRHARLLAPEDRSKYVREAASDLLTVAQDLTQEHEYLVNVMTDFVEPEDALPADLARRKLAFDRSYFTVQEMLSLLLTVERLDNVAKNQFLKDVCTFPYYDALAMWLDTPGWMEQPGFAELFLTLLARERDDDDPMIVTEEDLHLRFHACVHRQPRDNVAMMIAGFSRSEALWLREHGSHDGFRESLESKLDELEQL